MQQHIYFDDDDDDLIGQQEVKDDRVGHQCGGLNGGTGSLPQLDGSVESTGEYNVICADPAGDVLLESPRKQAGGKIGLNAGVSEPPGKRKKLRQAATVAGPYRASLSEAGPGVHGFHGEGPPADAAVHITMGVIAAPGAAADTQEAARRKKALRKRLKRKKRLQASMSPDPLVLGQAQGAGAAGSAAGQAEAAAGVTARQAATLLAGAGQDLVPVKAAATANIKTKKIKEATAAQMTTTGCGLPALPAVHAGAPGMATLVERPAEEGAREALRQAQCDRIAQDLLTSLQNGLQGVDIERVLAATMVKALEQRHGGRHSSSAHDSPGIPMMLDAAPLGALQESSRHVALPPPQRAPVPAHEASLQEKPRTAAPRLPQQLAHQAQGTAARNELGRAGLPALPPQAGRAHGIALAPQHRRSSPVQPLMQLPAGHGPVNPARRQGAQEHNQPGQLSRLQAPSSLPALPARRQQGQQLSNQAPVLALPAPQQAIGPGTKPRVKKSPKPPTGYVVSRWGPASRPSCMREGVWVSVPGTPGREAAPAEGPELPLQEQDPARVSGQRTPQQGARRAAAVIGPTDRRIRGDRCPEPPSDDDVEEPAGVEEQEHVSAAEAYAEGYDDGQEAEAPPFQASAADYEFPDSDKDEPEAEAAAHCLSEMAATPRAHLRSAAARPAGKGARPQSTAALTASSGPGQPSGSRLPREKRLAELMSAAPERLGLNAKREERTQPVTGGALAELASRAATERTPAKAVTPLGRGEAGQGAGHRPQIKAPPLPGRPLKARSVRPPRRLDPSAEGVPQWAAKPKAGQQEEPPARAAAPPQRGRQRAVRAAGTACPAAPPASGEPEGSQRPAKRAAASEAADAPPRKRAHTGKQPDFIFVAPTHEDLGYWDRPAKLKRKVPKFKLACVKGGIDKTKIKACHKCASQHLRHPCTSGKLECGPDHYKGNQHRQKLSFCFRCIEGTKRCYGLWRVVKDAKDPAKLALFKQGWCLKCLGLCPCSKCRRLKLTNAPDRSRPEDPPDDNPDNDPDEDSSDDDDWGPIRPAPPGLLGAGRRSSGDSQQSGPGAGSCELADADEGGTGASLGGGETTASEPGSMAKQRAAGQPYADSGRGRQPRADGGGQSNGQQNGNGNCSSGSHAQRSLPRALRRKLPKWLRDMDIQVMQCEDLQARAQDPSTPWISISKGLAVVDASGDIKLLYLGSFMSEGEARRTGGRLGSYYDKLVKLKRWVRRGRSKNLPRADGSIPIMVQVGNGAPRNDPHTILRTIAERLDPNLRLRADKVIAFIVRPIREVCPDAFTGLSDWERALVAMLPGTSVAAATITSDYQSPPHVDSGDECQNGLMSCVCWFARGKGPMPKDGWMRFQGLRLRLDTRNGACVLFDSAKLRHSTEECELSKAGEAARMGVALHCRKNLLAVARKDIPLLQQSMHDVYRGRLQGTRDGKGQVLRECDKKPVDPVWPEVY